MSNNLEYPPRPTSTPLTKAQRQAEHDAWKQRWQASQNQPHAVLSSAVGGSSAWLVAAVVGGVIWLVVLGGAVSQM